MAVDVVVVDYGIGNLFSVRRAFEHCGAAVEVSDNRDVILSAPRLVLPGVGAFSDGMRGLAERGLDEVVIAFSRSGKPLLGICLGMQMLATVSEEFGQHKGLNIIPGHVASIPRVDPQGQPYKVPFVGWADLASDNPAAWQNSILQDVPTGEAVYLVHSFAVTPDDRKHRLAYCTYNGAEVTAAIRKENAYGVQFHPEKSGKVGLNIISSFARCR
jgi:glutamine amidotransferase